MTYAPTALTSGTLTLRYAYTDSAGAAQTGLLNLPYAATTNDNVVATPAPSGQINAVVGMGSQMVSVTFTTDDGRPATALQLTSSLATLPAGWSSTGSSFACAGLGSGSGCQLVLTYAPPAAAAGTLMLGYAYKNNAGEPKTGSINIPYRATTNDNVVGTASQNPLLVVSGTSTVITVTFTTDDGNLASGLSVTSGLATLPTGWSSTSTDVQLRERQRRQWLSAFTHVRAHRRRYRNADAGFQLYEQFGNREDRHRIAALHRDLAGITRRSANHRDRARHHHDRGITGISCRRRRARGACRRPARSRRCDRSAGRN